MPNGLKDSDSDLINTISRNAIIFAGLLERITMQRNKIPLDYIDSKPE